jgi:hypothetical protein
MPQCNVRFPWSFKDIFDDDVKHMNQQIKPRDLEIVHLQFLLLTSLLGFQHKGASVTSVICCNSDGLGLFCLVRTSRMSGNPHITYIWNGSVTVRYNGSSCVAILYEIPLSRMSFASRDRLLDITNKFRHNKAQMERWWLKENNYLAQCPPRILSDDELWNYSDSEYQDLLSYGLVVANLATSSRGGYDLRATRNS